MATGIATASTIIRILAPAINDIYIHSKSALNKRIEAWKLGSNLEKFTHYYLRLSNIKTIWARDEAVSIDSFYYPSRARGNKKINSISELDSNCVIIEGIVGQGKSILMRHLAMTELKNENLTAIPLFIEFRNITDKKTLRNLLSETLGNLGASTDSTVLDHLLEENRITLFLDGYDELDPKLIKETNQEISTFQARYPDLRIIVSSRPFTDIQNLAGFKVVPLARLRPSDHRPFLKKLSVDEQKINEIIEAISNSPTEIQESISTPLMLSIVVLVYKSANQIPTHLAEFFKVLFHVVFTQHDSRKDSFRRPHSSGLSEPDLKELFETFCFSVTQKGYGRTLSSEQFTECFRQAQERKPNLKTTATNFKADIADVACLLLEEGVGELTFLHKGILDFFTASYASQLRKSDSAEKFYSSAARNFRNWKGALQFLSKIDTYRYNKFYLLTSVYNDWLSCKNIFSDASTPQQQIDFLDSLYLDSRIEKSKTGVSSRLRPRDSTEFFAGCTNYIQQEIPKHLLLHTTCDTIRETMLNTKGATFESTEGNGVAFNLRSALLAFGHEDLINRLRAVVNDYDVKFGIARKMIEAEDQQDEMLDMSFD